MRGIALLCALGLGLGCGGGHHPAAGDAGGSGGDAGGQGGDGGGSADAGAAPWSIALPSDTAWYGAAADRGTGRIVVMGRVTPMSADYPALRIQGRDSATGALQYDAVLHGDGLYPAGMVLAGDTIYCGGEDYSWTIYAYSAVDGHRVWAQSRTTPYDSCGSHPYALAVDGGAVFAVGTDNTTSCGGGNYDQEWVIEARDAATGNLSWFKQENPYNNAISDHDAAVGVALDAAHVYVLATTETEGWQLEARARGDGAVAWAQALGGNAWASGTFGSLSVDGNGVYTSFSGTQADPYGTGWSLDRRALADGTEGWVDTQAQRPQFYALLFQGTLLLASPGQPLGALAPDTGAMLATSAVVLPANASLFTDGAALFTLVDPQGTSPTLSRLAAP